MNTNAQTTMNGYEMGSFLDPEMASLLQMTNEVVMKIKTQTRENLL